MDKRDQWWTSRTS